MRNIYKILLAVILCQCSLAYAVPKVVEGDAAKQAYQQDKANAKALLLDQRDKKFSITMPDGEQIAKPRKLTIKLGDAIYIANSEEKFIHNIYDMTDERWIIRKQTPNSIAKVTFRVPGEHKVRCAIHPKMKITIKVEE